MWIGYCAGRRTIPKRELTPMITISVTETDYFLPEDGKIAEAKFLELLNNLTEVWICAFGFTLQPMFDELKKALGS